MYQCPADNCDEPFATLEGAAMHYVNKPGDDHGGYESKYEVKKAIESYQQTETETETKTETDMQTVSDGGSTKEQSEYDLPEFDHGGDLDQVQTHNYDCCGNPSITGTAGDMFRIDTGEVIQLESGEQICINCDTIHNGVGD
jgi:hypothetical protein